MIRAILFDLDGTLLDSAPDLVGALNRLRGARDMPPLDIPQMREHSGRGAIGLLQAGMPPADADTFESWRLEFLQYYAADSYTASRLFEGVRELIEYLNRSAIPWGIVTNKPEALTHPIIHATGLQASVSCVVCGDTLSRSKPDPAPVSLACSILDVAPEETLLVGDDVRDIEAGVSAGTQTMAVHYGYGSSELNKRGIAANFEIHQPGDLVDLLRRQLMQHADKPSRAIRG